MTCRLRKEKPSTRHLKLSWKEAWKPDQKCLDLCQLQPSASHQGVLSDRNEFQSEEVRGQDTLQEKVSLADRFGIQLAFVAPDQNEYLAIVRSMARRRNLNLPEEELRRQALQWVQLHNARSGRTARQFVDYVAAELGASKQP